MQQTLTDDTVTLAFTLDGLEVTASLPVPTGHEPIKDRVRDLTVDRDLAEWLDGQGWFNDLVDETVNRLLNDGLEAQITEAFGAKVFSTALALFNTLMAELTPEQRENRLRFYRPELITTTPDDPDYTVSVDMAAFANWTSTLKLPGLTTTLVPIAVRQWLSSMVNREDRDTLTLDGLVRKVEANIERFGADGVEVGIWSVVAPSEPAIRQVFPDLDSLEQLLGLVPNVRPDPTRLLLPTGTGPAGVGEGIAAAVANGWHPGNDGFLSYATLPKAGLSVRLDVSADGKSPITVAEEALRAVAEIDDIAAQLHQLLSDLALRQPNPWVDRFRVSTDDILDSLSLGRLGRSARSAQADRVVASLHALSRVLVSLDWEDDPDYRRSYSDLWSVGYNESRQLDPYTGLPTRYDLRVTPGAWAELCLERVNGRADVLWHGYAPAAVAKQSSLVGQLLRFYHQTTETRFTVHDWLVGSCSRTSIKTQLGNPRSKARLKGRFLKALPVITETALIAFDLHDHPRDWLKTQVVKRVMPVVPGPAVFTDLKRMRLNAGITQAEAAAKAGYDRSYYSRIERSPGQYPGAARDIRDALKMHITDVHNSDKP